MAEKDVNVKEVNIGTLVGDSIITGLRGTKAMIRTASIVGAGAGVAYNIGSLYFNYEPVTSSFDLSVLQANLILGGTLVHFLFFGRKWITETRQSYRELKGDIDNYLYDRKDSN